MRTPAITAQVAERSGKRAKEAIDGIGDKKKMDELRKKLKGVYDTKANSSHRTGELRTYRDLVDEDERFDITKITRIERSADRDDIANKWCDFSFGTISKLFEQGTLDALKTLAKEIMISNKDKKEGIQDAFSQLDLFIRNAEKQGANGDLIQSAESVKAMLPVLM